jgi:hypothetical protein
MIGTTLVTWYLNNADSIPILGFTLDKALICSHYNSNIGLLFSNTLAMAFINPYTDLKYGANSVTMEVSDITGKVSAQGKITRLNSVVQEIKAIPKITIDLKDLEELKDSELKKIDLDHNFFSGNLVSVDFENDEDSDFDLQAFNYANITLNYTN